MSLISRFWNNLKTQPDIWFFFGFLLTFTLSIRKVLFFFPIQKTFNEYSGAYIYLSDIFLILTFIFWFISILCNNSSYLSILKLCLSSVLHNLPPHQKYKDNLYKIKIYPKDTFKTRQKRILNFWWRGTYITLPLFLVFLSFGSILWSPIQSIAFFRSIKILEFYILYIYIINRLIPQLFYACLPARQMEQFDLSDLQKDIPDNSLNVPRGTISKYTSPQLSPCKGDGDGCSTWNILNTKIFFWIIIFSGFIQGIIGIIQFFLQKSIGLFWLRESLISPEILGVAKIILNGEKYIRAYGLMPHPNVLGGFLLFSIIITLLYKKLFHACLPVRQVEQDTPHLNHILMEEEKLNVPRGTFSKYLHYFTLNCSTWNNCFFGNNWIFIFILTIQTLALILTFSKSAIIGLIIAFFYINVPRGTIHSPFSFIRRRTGDEVKLFHACLPARQVEQFKILILSSLIILISIIFIVKPNLDSIFIKSLNERLFYLDVPRGTFETDPFLGIGAGQSVLSMQKFYSQTLEFWQYQPVHNVFLLIFSEFGLIGLGLFIWWLWKLFHSPKNVPRGTIKNKELNIEQLNNREKGIIDNNKYILNNNNTYLSSIIILRYFKGILLGLLFIMLFDHYLWDIQQGSLLFWLTAGFIAEIIRK